MSIRGMLRRQARAYDEDEVGSPLGAPSDVAEKPRDIGEVLDTIATLIPTEALAGYWTILGFTSPETSPARWLCLAAGLLLVFVVVLLPVKDEPKPPRGRRWVIFAFAAVAFTIYSSMLPASPFEVFGWFRTQIGASAGVVFAVTAPRFASYIGVNLIRT